MLSIRQIVAVGATLTVAATGIAFAQDLPTQQPMRPGHMPEMMQSGQHPMEPGSDAGNDAASSKGHDAHALRYARRHRDPNNAGSGRLRRDPGNRAYPGGRPEDRLVEGRSRSAASAPDRHERGNPQGRRGLKTDRGRFGDRRHGHRPRARRHSAHDPCLAQTVNGLNGWAAKADTLPNMGNCSRSPQTTPKRSSISAALA